MELFKTSNLLKYSVALWLLLHTLYFLLSECVFINFKSIPWALVTFFIVFIALYFNKLSPPSRGDLEEVFGIYRNNGLQQKLTALQEKLINAVPVVAHRGASIDSPENTISAFRSCKNKGCNMVQFDVSMTRDGVAVLIHEETLERITNLHKRAQDMTYAEMRNLRLNDSSGNKDIPSAERIATLEEAVQECLSLKLHCIMNIRTNTTKAAAKLIETFHRSPALFKTAMVASFNPLFIYQVRRADPRIVCALSWRPFVLTYTMFDGIRGPSIRRNSEWWRHLLALLADYFLSWMFKHCLWHFLGISVVLVHKDVLTADLIRHFNEHNVSVIGWTVNSTLEKTYLLDVLQVPYMTDTLSSDVALDNKRRRGTVSGGMGSEARFQLSNHPGESLYSFN